MTFVVAEQHYETGCLTRLFGPYPDYDTAQQAADRGFKARVYRRLHSGAKAGILFLEPSPYRYRVAAERIVLAATDPPYGGRAGANLSGDLRASEAPGFQPAHQFMIDATRTPRSFMHHPPTKNPPGCGSESDSSDKHNLGHESPLS
jgi:hypothetical protein